jgi:RluA family pseudouridine synthase
MAMNILYSDEALLVIDKPAGLPVLQDGWDRSAPYLVNILEEQSDKIFVVHRLDKVTSGVILFARSAEAHRKLNAQFEQHSPEKIYHAIVSGAPVWDEHTAKHPLRVDVGHQHRTAVDPKRGKAAETRFNVLKRYPAGTSPERSRGALLEALPLTGRTHQIRAHLSALGFPILADQLYGAPSSELIGRPALHAYSLTIVHPESGKEITFSAPYPPDFATTLEKLQET